MNLTEYLLCILVLEIIVLGSLLYIRVVRIWSLVIDLIAEISEVHRCEMQDFTSDMLKGHRCEIHDLTSDMLNAKLESVVDKTDAVRLIEREAFEKGMVIEKKRIAGRNEELFE